MRSLPSALVNELANDAHAGLAVLVDIASDTPIRRTSWSASITFDAKAYTPDTFEFGSVGGALRPASPTISLSFQNLRDPTNDNERPWSLLLGSDPEALNGVEVSVLVVMLSQLADTTAKIDETRWVIQQVPRVDSACELSLGPPFDLATLYAPQAQLRAGRCRWEYKDGLCKSDSTFPTCPTKDVAACSGRHKVTHLRMSQLPFDVDMRRRVG